MSTLITRRPLLSSFLDDDTLAFPEGLLTKEGSGPVARFFDRAFFRDATLPAVNIKENTGHFAIELAVPGFKKEDLKVNVKDGVLTISSEKKLESEEEKKGYTRKEFSYASFSRSFALPENTDAGSLKAKFADGVLKLELKKTVAVPASKGREIKIG